MTKLDNSTSTQFSSLSADLRCTRHFSIKHASALPPSRLTTLSSSCLPLSLRKVLVGGRVVLVELECLENVKSKLRESVDLDLDKWTSSRSSSERSRMSATLGGIAVMMSPVAQGVFGLRAKQEVEQYLTTEQLCAWQLRTVESDGETLEGSR